MEQVKGYDMSKDQRLISCKTECGNLKCYARRYGLFAEKTCANFIQPSMVTNADRIRAMTDEELAEFIVDGLHDICPHNCLEDLDRPCKVCSLDWLKQEAET